MAELVDTRAGGGGAVTCEGFTPAGATIFLGEPLSIKISRDADAPADGLTAEFPHRSLPDLCRVRIWDGGTLYFSGIVDEQHEILALSGMTVLPGEWQPRCWTVRRSRKPTETHRCRRFTTGMRRRLGLRDAAGLPTRRAAK